MSYLNQHNGNCNKTDIKTVNKNNKKRSKLFQKMKQKNDIADSCFYFERFMINYTDKTPDGKKEEKETKQTF